MARGRGPGARTAGCLARPQRARRPRGTPATENVARRQRDRANARDFGHATLARGISSLRSRLLLTRLARPKKCPPAPSDIFLPGGTDVAVPPLVEPAAELTVDEVRRYSRHLIIPAIGMAGQKRLKNAKVLCVG